LVVQGGEKQGKVQKLSKGEVLMLNIGSMCTGARVIAVCHCLLLHTADKVFHRHHHSVNNGRTLCAYVFVQSEKAINTLLLIPILRIPFLAYCTMLLASKGMRAQSKLLGVSDARV